MKDENKTMTPETEKPKAEVKPKAKKPRVPKTKVCNEDIGGCGVRKRKEHFAKHPTSKDGHIGVCKECNSELMSKRRQKTERAKKKAKKAAAAKTPRKAIKLDAVNKALQKANGAPVSASPVKGLLKSLEDRGLDVQSIEVQDGKCTVKYLVVEEFTL